MRETTIAEGKQLGRDFPLNQRKDFCMETHEGEFGDWTCTREPGHDGQHMAHNVQGEVAALWDQRCDHGMFFTGAGACPQCGGGAEPDR
jgi:hypothetical protein